MVANKGVIDVEFVEDSGDFEHAIRLMDGFRAQSLSAFLLKKDSVELFYGSRNNRFPQCVTIAYSDVFNCLTEYAKELFVRNAEIIDFELPKDLDLADRCVIDYEAVIDEKQPVRISLEQKGNTYNGEVKFGEMDVDSIWTLSGSHIDGQSIIRLKAKTNEVVIGTFSIFWNENDINGTFEDVNGDVFNVGGQKNELPQEMEYDL